MLYTCMQIPHFTICATNKKEINGAKTNTAWKTNGIRKTNFKY
jgi:hypothetical protein